MLRILSHQCADGPTQMATDEALLAAATQCTLRTYTWSKPCLSLGYFQAYPDSAATSTFPPDLEMVRRITGGGAIYHIHEVTYCLIAQRGSDVPQRSHDMFQVLHQHILDALSDHQVDATLNPQQHGDKRYQQDIRCFASPAPHDLMIGRGKLLGSAARQVKDRVLVHGSLKLHSNDWDQDSVAGCQLSPADVQRVLIDGISHALGLDKQHDELSTSEHQLIAEYKQARYGDTQWLKHRKGPRACFK